MKKLFLTVLLGILATGAAQAKTLAETNAAEFGLNQASQNQMQKYRLGTALMKNRVHSLKGTYNFAVDGGSSSAAITLKGSDGKAIVIPNKAIVRDCLIDVIAGAYSSSSSTATMALSTGQSAGDLKAALVSSSYSTSSLIACIPVGTAATAIKMTADRTPTATIAVSNFTAGKINVLIQYEMSE